MFPHKYVKLYETEEDYEQALNNHELEEVAVSAIIGDRTETPDRYLYSIRTTNNDNERLGPFNQEDPIKYFGGLEIIWGYWGWKWEDVEYNGETLHGGHFEPIKETTTYPEIIDGYRLLHINNLIRSTPKVTEVGYFDTSNVVSANNAFYSTVIKKLNNLEWPSLKSANSMFYKINDSIIGASSDSPKVLSFPELVTLDANEELILYYVTSDNYILNFGKLTKFNVFLSITYSDIRFNINQYVKGLENCYDYSTIRNNSQNRIRYISLDFNPTYTGSNVILLPIFGNRSIINCVKPSKANTTFIYGNYDTLSSCYNDGLNWNSLENINFSGTSKLLEYFTIDTTAPFTERFKNYNTTIYYGCTFNCEDFEFDCSNNFQNSSSSTYYFREFTECKLNNTNITLKNLESNTDKILELKVTRYSGGTGKIDLNLNGKTCSFSSVTISGGEVFKPIENANITLKEVSLYSSRCDISCDLKNVVINGQADVILTGNIENSQVIFKDLHSIFTIKLDMTGLTIKSLENAEIFCNFSNCVKSPHVEGKISELNFGSYQLLEEIYLSNAIHTSYNNHISAVNLKFNNYTNLKILNLGSGWINLNISYCKLILPETLYNSIIRRNLDKQGELQLHRVIWDLFTSELLLFITSKFTVIKIVEDEQSESINLES